MKALWFQNIPFPAARERLGRPPGGKGWWLVAWAKALAQVPDLELAVAWASQGVSRWDEFQHEDISYYLIPVSKIGQGFQSFNQELAECRRAIEDFGPDIVHVHGTESFYGLLGGTVPAPVVISIQGILAEICRSYFGQMGPLDILAHPRVLRTYWNMVKRTRVEREVFVRNQFFIGMTFWTQSHVAKRNPSARYYHCPRIERDSFYTARWSLDKARRNTIYCSSSSNPYKGIDCLLDALSILRHYVPDVQLRLGGGFPKAGYGRYIRRKIRRLGLQDAVALLGYLEEEEIAQELSQAHVYVLPSFIESMSNSLAEAMLVGCPCVASFSGGPSSLVAHEESGLLFPKGDAAMLAMYLRQVLEDDTLAEGLSSQARAMASERHDRQKATEMTLAIYRDVIAQS
jgi:glycosyltransferase involved in cell wall biosynthesis